MPSFVRNIRDNLYQFPENVPITPHARDIITAFLHPKPENRPSIDDVMEHPYFDRSLIPRSIPLSALVETPVFDFKSEIEVSSVNSPIQRLKSHATLRSPVPSPGSIGMFEAQHLPPKLPPRAQELANDPYPVKVGNINKDLPPPALPSRSMPPRAFSPRSPMVSVNSLAEASPQKQLMEKFSQASLKSPSPSIKNSASSWVDTPEKASGRNHSSARNANYSSSSQQAVASDNQENMPSPSIRSSQSNSMAASLSLATATAPPPPSQAAPMLAATSNSTASSSNSSPSTLGKANNSSTGKKEVAPVPLTLTSKTTSALDQIYNLLKSEIKRAASLSSSLKTSAAFGSVLDTGISFVDTLKHSPSSLFFSFLYIL